MNVDLDLVKTNFMVDGDVDTDAKKNAHKWFLKFLDESASMLCK